MTNTRREFAGPIATIGATVKDFKVGDHVVAYTGTGGYAEYAIAKASEMRPVPAGISSAQATTIPTIFLTA